VLKIIEIYFQPVYHLVPNIEIRTVWAADFETPVGSSTLFFFYFFWAALAERNNK
jgi:hypothetical protein